ncbi:VanW family protein [Lederbergia panacisoli]|uniref:VanW family protein n=1 Tax=Lederbergia panacisoli TaxID=1255251 RepID=UPI00214B005D|nr:VanW family protein [Lederbergia panacisoli]MCR2820553.1 VanW family protein [Lederbergia panacisoli]
MTVGKLKILFLILVSSSFIVGCSQVKYQFSNNPQASVEAAANVEEENPDQESQVVDTYVESIISEVNKKILHITPNFQLLLDSIQDIEISGKSQFSLLHHINNLKLSTIDGKTASDVASILYELVLQSNLIIMERNISTTLDRSNDLGIEAKMDHESQQDFSFYNPNNEPIKITWEQTGKGVIARLLGPTQDEHYQIRFEDKKSYPPKIIKQYSPALKNNEVQIKEKGKDGSSIIVIKETINSSNEVIAQEVVAKDFYLPVHRIEIHSLVKVNPNNEIAQTEERTDFENAENVDNPDNAMNSNRQDPNEEEENDFIWTDPGDIVK